MWKNENRYGNRYEFKYTSEDVELDNGTLSKQNEENIENAPTMIELSEIGEKTEKYGVQIDGNLIGNYQTWLKNNPNGIVAYRVNKATFNTAEAVKNGIIGNPFDWQKYGTVNATQMFYSWLTTGNTFNEPLANEEFRQAIVDKLIESGENTPILYYKELGYPSHATILGYLAKNKNKLKDNSNIQISTTQPVSENSTWNDENEFPTDEMKHCKGD